MFDNVCSTFVITIFICLHENVFYFNPFLHCDPNAITFNVFIKSLIFWNNSIPLIFYGLIWVNIGTSKVRYYQNPPDYLWRRLLTLENIKTKGFTFKERLWMWSHLYHWTLGINGHCFPKLALKQLKLSLYHSLSL